MYRSKMIIEKRCNSTTIAHSFYIILKKAARKMNVVEGWRKA